MSRKFSLRAHQSPIACITTFENNLVSADRDGNIVVWDIFRKRPLALWKAHLGQIISIQLTPLGLLTHGRDSSIRIWEPPFTGLDNDVSILSVTGPDAQSLDTSELLSQNTPTNFELPVNALNFCNVAYCNGLLATPATRDSENFDIYRLLEDFSLLRIVENYSCPKDTEMIASPDQRAGSGIIMRLLFIDDSLLFAGYESGRIVGYRLKSEVVSSLKKNERLILNKGTKLTVVMDVKAHTPHPVLSLEYESSSGKLYTGSASKKLSVYSIKHLVREEDQREEKSEEGMEVLQMESHNLHHYGIQSLQVGENILVAGFWDGFILILAKNCTLITEFERNEEFIQPEQENEAGRTSKKSLCTHIWHPQPDKEDKPSSRKALMRKKRNESDSLLLVGYGDGLISAYSV